MIIVFLQTLNEHWKKRFDELIKEFPEVEFINSAEPEKRIELLKSADGVMAYRLDENDLTTVEKLKAVFVPFTGLNTFPLEELKRRNIFISNTHANAPYVAEHALTLALSLLGRVTEMHNNLREGKWRMSIQENDMWTSLRNKTCSIIGLGHIGTHLAQLLKSFDCKVIGFKKTQMKIIPECVDEITLDVKEAIEKGQIVFVCLPLYEQTKGIITKEILTRMKGKFLVNIGRGETIDEEGLYLSLKNGILESAAIDAWYQYPTKKNPEPIFPSRFPFHELTNIVLSPHKSSHTTGAINAMIDDTVENIRSFLKTGKPKQVVGKDEIY